MVFILRRGPAVYCMGIVSEMMENKNKCIPYFYMDVIIPPYPMHLTAKSAMTLRYKEEQLNLFIHLNPYLSKIILNIDKSVKVNSQFAIFYIYRKGTANNNPII